MLDLFFSQCVWNKNTLNISITYLIVTPHKIALMTVLSPLCKPLVLFFPAICTDIKSFHNFISLFFFLNERRFLY